MLDNIERMVLEKGQGLRVRALFKFIEKAACLVLARQAAVYCRGKYRGKLGRKKGKGRPAIHLAGFEVHCSKFDT